MRVNTAAIRCLSVTGATLAIIGSQGFAAKRAVGAAKPRLAVKAAKAPLPGLQPTKHPNVWVRFAPRAQRPAPLEASIYVMPGAKIPDEGLAPRSHQHAAPAAQPAIYQLPNGGTLVLTDPSEMDYVHATIDGKGRTVVTCGPPPKAAPVKKAGVK